MDEQKGKQTKRPRMTVELQVPPAPRFAELEIDIRLCAQVHVTASTAQRKVSKLMLDRVSDDQVGDFQVAEDESGISRRKALSGPLAGPCPYERDGDRWTVQ